MIGINYYFDTPFCTHCRTKGKRYHLGKAYIGWTFTFRAHPADTVLQSRPVRSAADWREALRQPGSIIDEGGRVLTVAQFWAFVDLKKKPYDNGFTPATFQPATGWNDPGGIVSRMYPLWLDAEGNAFRDFDFEAL